MLMRTDPFREFDRLTSQVMGSPSRPVAMPIDAYRHGDVFVIELDVPGVSPESVELTVEKNVLTVRAERPRSQVTDRDQVIAERPHGMFSRQLFLGDTLDAANLTADCDHGVLTIRVPVAERAKPRRIQIGTSREVPVLDAAEAQPAGVGT